MNLIPKNLSQLRRIALSVLLASFAILETTSISAQELGRTITSPFGIARQTSASESGSDGDTFVDPETGEVGHIIRNPFGVANPEGVDTGIDIPDDAGEEVGGIITSPFGVPASDDIDTGVDVFDEDEEYLISLPDDEESDMEDSEDMDAVDDETSDDAKELEGESAETTTEKFVPVVDNPTRGGEYPSNDFYIEGRCGNLVVTSETDLNGAVPTLYVPDNSSCLISAEIQGNIPSGNPQWFIKTSNSTLISLPDQTGSHRYIFQTTPNTYGRTYTVLCRISGGTIQERAINISIYKVEGLKVYDPKLEDAGSAHYTLTGSGISKFVVENSSGTIVDTLSVTNDGHFSWNGRWGKNPDESEINTNYTGKFADPGKYTLHIVYPTSSNANNISPIESYAIYVVRLGVTEIEFQGVNPDEYFPLRFVATENRALSPIETDEGEQIDSESVPDMRSNRDALPQLNPIPVDTTGKLLNVRWRIGDDESGDDNADIIYNLGHQNDFGNRREHITPYVNYPQELDSIFKPPMKDNALVKGTWNLPVCYKIGSRIKIKAKTSPKAYSQVRCEQNGSIGGNDYSGLLDTSELGFNEQGRPIIMMSVKRIWENEENDNEEEVLDGVVSDNGTVSPFNILPGEVYTFRDNDQATPSVKTCVGGDTIRFDFTWKYQVSPNVYVDIPGKMVTKHKVYSIFDKPKGPWEDEEALWIAALHYSTSWAMNKTEQSDIADAITEHVNRNLGLTYDTSIGAPSFIVEGSLIPLGANPPDLHGHNYSCFVNIFKCRDFLTYLSSRNNPENPSSVPPKSVNCLDCANIVATFSCILGCELKVTFIGKVNGNGGHPFALNPIKSIGGSGFGLPFPSSPAPEPVFHYHAIVKDSSEYIWDACLEVADTPDSQGGQYTPVLPKHMRYNNSSTNPSCLGPESQNQTALATSSPNPVPIQGNNAKGVLQIIKVYEEANNDGVIACSPMLRCTNISGDSVTFTWLSNQVIPVDGNCSTITIPQGAIHSEEKDYTTNGIKIFRYRVSKNIQTFDIDDTFILSLSYDYCDYRSRLAAPDQKIYLPSQGQDGIRGRSPASYLTGELSMIILQ